MGNAVWQYDNADPFGNNTPNENPSNQGQFHFNLRFPGQYYDTETGLSYNVNRDYDASIGRYVESDPIGLAAGVNTYTYVGGNPLTGKDPMGLSQLCKSGMHGTRGLIVGPLYHEFNCFETRAGNTVCKGFGPRDSSDHWIEGTVPGRIEDGADNFATAKEKFQDNSCEPDDHNACMNQCLEDLYNEYSRNVPGYTVNPLEKGRGQQCHEIAEGSANYCKKQCRVTK